MQERRAFPRLPIRLKVMLRLSSGETIGLRSVDISKQGMQLLSDYDADVGDNFPLAFSLPRVGDEGFEHIQLMGEVMHVVYDGSFGGYRLGFRFKSFHRDSRERLEGCLDQYLNQHLRRGHPA